MHSTIHAVCGQQKGQNRAKSHVTDINFFFFLVKRAGRHFGFFKRAGHHENGAGRRALQKKPRQNTEIQYCLVYPHNSIEMQSLMIKRAVLHNNKHHRITGVYPSRLTNKHGMERNTYTSSCEQRGRHTESMSSSGCGRSDCRSADTACASYCDAFRSWMYPSSTTHMRSRANIIYINFYSAKILRKPEQKSTPKSGLR